MKLKILLPIMALTLIIGACHENGIDAHGPIVRETRTVDAFTAIDSSLPANIFISQDLEHGVVIETHEDILPIIESYVSGEELILGLTRSIRNIDRLNIYVTAEDYQRIRLSGAANLESEECLSLNGLVVQLSGAGNVNLCGTADQLSVGISGAGNFRGYDMVAREVSAIVSGAGNMRVTAEELLDVTISGAGSIRYRGNPQIFQNISGAGSLINAN